MKMRNVSRQVVALVVLALMTLSAACGESSDTVRSHTKASGTRSSGAAKEVSVLKLPQIELTMDPDQDSDNYSDEPDNEHKLFGHPAAVADARAARSLVRRYYATVASGDGSAACALLYSALAEAIPQDYGRPPGPPNLRGKTCAVVMSKLLQPRRGRLSRDSATLTVGAVRVDLNLGSVQLGFGGSRPNRYILLHRERGVWKVDLLFDTGQPVGVE
jgi:hypothetical protein